MPANTALKLSHYTIPLALAIIVTLIAIIGSEASQWLRYDRDAILGGELWRAITGHLAHLSWSHLAMNLAGLGLIWVIFGTHLTTKRWLILLVFGALGTTTLLLIYNPTLRWYVGLSGVLHTLFIAGVLVDLKHGRWDSRLLLALIIAKLAYEQIWGPMPGSEESAGGNVIVDAHLYGAICGLAMFIIYTLWDKYHSKKTP